MRIAITGGRDRFPGDAELTAFSALWKQLGGTVMVNGGKHRMEGGRIQYGTGVDLALVFWAAERGIKVDFKIADWGAHGRAAGPVRNGEMVASADFLVAFKGGRGTADCTAKARRRGLTVYEITPEGMVIPG